MRNSILLTATVTPNVSGTLALGDPAARLAQYRRAIAVWQSAAARAGFELHVVETSGASADSVLSEIRSVERARVSFANFTPGAESIARGKGAAELSAISWYAHSRDLFSGPGCLYKVTGRLTVANASRCVRPLRAGQIRARMSLDRSYVDTRMIGASSDTWPKLIDAALPNIDDTRGIYLEHAVAAYIAFAAALHQVEVTRFAERPTFVGSSGTGGARYGSRVSRVGAALLRPIEEGLAAIAGRKSV